MPLKTALAKPAPMRHASMIVALTWALLGMTGAALAQETRPRTSLGIETDAEVALLVRQAALDCDIRQARLRGRDANDFGLYEISCRQGLGYLILGSSPPVAHPCLMLQGLQLDRRPDRPRRANPPQCELPGNTDPVPELMQRARDAGIGCDIDAVAVLGLDIERRPLIEVGCRERDGFWLAGADSRDITSCLIVTAQGGTCGFTTAQEQASETQGWLQGLPGACLVTEARFRGHTATHEVYEIGCADGTGRTFERDAAGVVGDLRDCQDSALVGRACIGVNAGGDRR